MDNKIIILTISCILVFAFGITSFFLRGSIQEKLSGNSIASFDEKQDKSNGNSNKNSSELVTPTEDDWQMLGTEFSENNTVTKFRYCYKTINVDFNSDSITFDQIVPCIIDPELAFVESESKNEDGEDVFDGEKVRTVSENIFNITPPNTDENNYNDLYYKSESDKYYLEDPTVDIDGCEFRISDEYKNAVPDSDGKYTLTVEKNTEDGPVTYGKITVGLKRIDGKTCWSLYNMKRVDNE